MINSETLIFIFVLVKLFIQLKKNHSLSALMMSLTKLSLNMEIIVIHQSIKFLLNKLLEITKRLLLSLILFQIRILLTYLGHQIDMVVVAITSYQLLKLKTKDLQLSLVTRLTYQFLIQVLMLIDLILIKMLMILFFLLIAHLKVKILQKVLFIIHGITYLHGLLKRLKNQLNMSIPTY